MRWFFVLLLIIGMVGCTSETIDIEPIDSNEPIKADVDTTELESELITEDYVEIGEMI